MLIDKTIILSVAFFTSSVFGQTSDKDFLKKPHVLPSAEAAYHAVYHELDSVKSGNRDEKVFGQLYVALIEDQFTFGGDLSTWPDSAFQKGDRGCKPFMAANLHNLCNNEYFLVHQDMIKLVKTVFERKNQADPSFDTICLANNGFVVSDDPENHLVYRYKHRIPMTYKATSNDQKCFGTYDTRTDTFTCMRYDASTKKMSPFELQNFLWKENTGTFHLGNGNAEVFCKKPFYTNK
ncbi:DUF1176 domain-containing protein [Caenorhabditis elegans]|uniref:DUF1176 domain-containing protein n=1 Tax=Caenorhabditis elegans TaxID=6239 RepID=Q9XUT6_CAEEL|nr:DUF1176 domain-containing protein [Caenorhabditis elegans]CAB04585.1 DUF1176 domain-containing protein [Caenorhabditis elegans]|eukprot:NP_492935.1 Uncharacterized protein CELE_K08C9.2 [Caenorhabditis elegans]